MYKLKQINHYSSGGTWGAFKSYKSFSVTRAGTKKENIRGFVIQKVTKTSEVYKLDGDAEVLIDDIDKFTGEQVKYMNSSYYELFYVEGGQSESGDSFQNGAVLRYEYDPEIEEYYGDDEPPTSGKIHMHGESCFIPSIESPLSTDLFGVKWSLSEDTPANGLHYVEHITPEVLRKCKSNVVHHDVVVRWDGINGRPKTHVKSRIDN